MHTVKSKVVPVSSDSTLADLGQKKRGKRVCMTEETINGNATRFTIFQRETENSNTYLRLQKKLIINSDLDVISVSRAAKYAGPIWLLAHTHQQSVKERLS